MRVPSEAGEGQAKVTLSFPDWKEGNVGQGRIEVALAKAAGKDAAGGSSDEK